MFYIISISINIFSAVNFYKENRLDSTFLKKISLNANTTKIITSLNINCIYWIESKVLLSCIKKLQMLECLYVVGTGLNVAHFDTTVATALPHVILQCEVISDLHL